MGGWRKRENSNFSIGASVCLIMRGHMPGSKGKEEASSQRIRLAIHRIRLCNILILYKNVLIKYFEYLHL